MSLGFYFDGTRCAGCKSCQVACKDRFDLQVAGPRTRRVTTYETGSFPHSKLFHTSISCNHCDEPACVSNCPTGAMYKDEDGTVQHSDELCIGCQMCVMACPYHAPQYNEDDRVVVKCDTCRPLREAGMNPVCVDACPMRALDFGEMSDLAGWYGSDAVNELPCMPNASVTHPNVLFKVKDAANSEEFREVAL